MDFGEVVTTSSRAFWNDYEELELTRPDDESLSLDYGSTTPEHIATQLSTVDTLLCIEGPTVTAFAETAILQSDTTGAQLLCTVVGRKCSVHLLADGGGRTAVVVAAEHDLMVFGGIVELLVPLIGRIPRVCTISVEPAVAYKTGAPEADRRQPCFVRGLGSKGAVLDGVQALGEPNFVTGVAAGIVSWRQFSDLPWSSYVAYVNEPKLNSLTTAPILKLIRQLGINCASTYTLRATNESNLYT